MRPIVLVHGAWHGAWCWRHVVDALSAEGARVSAIDLPGAGEDRRPVAGISLDDYADAIVRAVEAFDEPVLLVGHSFGGIAITAAAERAPDRIARLVYLSAHLPGDGDSTMSLLQWLASDGVESHPLVPVENGAGLAVDDDEALIFYSGCGAADIAYARERRTPVPSAVAGTPVTRTAERGGRVPRSYIVCTADRAFPPERQRRLVERAGDVETLEIASDHSPFFSRPAELASMIGDLARR